jgi:hypothetical protein
VATKNPIESWVWNSLMSRRHLRASLRVSSSESGSTPTFLEDAVVAWLLVEQPFPGQEAAFGHHHWSAALDPRPPSLDRSDPRRRLTRFVDHTEPKLLALSKIPVWKHLSLPTSCSVREP